MALADKYVMFESVPLNMPSVKTAVLQNSGQNHAYYQVSTGKMTQHAVGIVASRELISGALHCLSGAGSLRSAGPGGDPVRRGGAERREDGAAGPLQP